MQPDNLLKISKSVEGRFVPVYRDHAKGDFWEKSKFAEMRKIAENGRIRELAGRAAAVARRRHRCAVHPLGHDEQDPQRRHERSRMPRSGPRTR